MKTHSFRPTANSRGSALLIVLAFLLLLTTLTIAFLGRATLERLLASASVNQNKVDLTSQGAIATILSDLQQEIVAGSNGGSINLASSSAYYPTTSRTAVPETMVPVDSSGGGTSPVQTVTPQLAAPAIGMEDLLKESYRSTPFYKSIGTGDYNNTGPIRAASVSTQDASINNRSVTAVRWNKPLFLARMYASTTSKYADLTPMGKFVVPDWIYVAKDGSNPTTTLDSSYIYSPNVSPRATPATGTLGTNPVTQRFAYTIYDEGGTLDLNVAGNPSYKPVTSLNYSSFQPYKNTLAYADLTQLPYVSQTAQTVSDGAANTTTSSTLTSVSNQVALINAITCWRNYASGMTSTGTIAGSFPNYTITAATSPTLNGFDRLMLFATNGFLGTGNSALTSTNAGDNAFTSRQQLLQFFLQGAGQNATFYNAVGGNQNVTLSTLENIMPYLGTFSRDINQPSYAPDPNRPTVLATGNGGNDLAGQSSQNAINPAFLSQTVPATPPLTRNDGTLASTGDLLVKKRFALSRLAWLTYQGVSSGRTLTSPSSTLFSNGNSNTDYDIYLLENTYGFSSNFLAQGTAANVYKYFGLSWVSDTRPTGISGTGDSQMKWVYNHTQANPATGVTTSPISSLGSAGTTRIWTLSQVAAAGREPDFFELLKAAMTVGSLGKPAQTASTTVTTYQFNKDTSLDAQIIQIGANIIDQFDTDSIPTRILFNDGNSVQAQEFRGVEDLPYFYSVTGAYSRMKDTSPTFTTAINGPNNGTPSPTVTPIADASSGAAAFFQVPSIWNPHALNPNATSATAANVAAYAATMGPRPTQFRIFAIGGTPNMTAPPSVGDPNQIQVEGACYYSGGTGAPSGIYVNTTTYAPTTGLQQAVSLNPPGSGLPDSSLVFSIPCSYAGSGSPTTTWRPDLFREPTLLNKPNVPSGSSLAFGSGNIVRTAPYSTLFATQLANGNGGLENSLGDTNASYTSVTATDAGSTTGKPAYLGIFLGAFPLSWNYNPSGIQNYIISAGLAVTAQNLTNLQTTYRMQFADPVTGNWITYDEKFVRPVCYGWGANEYNINAGGQPTKSNMVLPNVMTGDQDVYVFADPRSSRFGAFFSDPGLNSVINNGIWEWPMLVRLRNVTSNYYNVGNRTGWAAPTNASSASSNQTYSLNAATQNAMWTFRPDEEGGFCIGSTTGNTAPPTTLGWYSVGLGPWQLGNICQNNPASTDITSLNGFGFFSAIDTFGHPGSTSVQFYADADGVVRRAMAGYVQPGINPNWSGENTPAAKRPSGSPSGIPLAWTYQYASTGATIPGQATPDTTYSNNLSSRPIILNRPFRSVAELGHVYSDTPWRNLDFSTPESGSSALLDTFCINDTNDPGGMVAGKINLNTRQAACLQAVLGGAYKDEFSPTLTTTQITGMGSSTTATADNIAKALVTRTSTATLGSGPLCNISELVGKYAGSTTSAAGASGAFDGGQSYIGFSGAPTTASGTSPVSSPANLSSVLVGDTSSSNYYSTTNIQRYREATIRALSAAGTTRVWNLMIDVIAQTGRFPASASTLTNFNVEGERRYWVHVAIDRYTGKIIDEQIEEVKE